MDQDKLREFIINVIIIAVIIFAVVVELQR